MLDLLIRGMVKEMVSQRIPFWEAVRRFRRAYIRAAMEQSGGCGAKAARLIHVPVSTLYDNWETE